MSCQREIFAAQLARLDPLAASHMAERRSGRRGGAAADEPPAAPPGPAPAAALEVLPTDDPATAAWKQEIAEITKGTHPTLVAELEKHEAALAQSNESARRIHARQRSIIEKLYECDAKQAEDEFTAQLEFAKARIVDSLEKKAAKGSSNPGAFGRSRPNGAANGAAGGSGEPAEKRPRTSAGGLGMLPAATFALLPADVKADLDAITADVQHYTPRGAEDIVMRGQGGDVYFDKVRSRLHINQLTFERGHAVYVLQQNTRVDDDPWEISAINSLEVTLRDTDSVKHKIQLAQLRSGRHAFKHAGRRPAENAW